MVGQLVILMAVVAAHVLGHQSILVIEQQPISKALQGEFAGGILTGNGVAIGIDPDAELTVDPDGFDHRRLIGQGMQWLELFLREEFLGSFMSLAMDPHIGHRIQPMACGRVDGLKIRQFQSVEEVLLYISYTVFGAPFFLRLADTASPDGKTVMVGKIQVTRMERNGVGTAVEHGHLAVIDPDLAYDSAEVFKSVLVSTQKVLQRLGQ